MTCNAGLAKTARMAQRARFSLALPAAAAVVVAGWGQGCTCSKAGDARATEDAGGAPGDGSDAERASPARVDGEGRGLSAPIAATRTEGGDVVVAGLDSAGAAIRVQRIDAKDHVIAERSVLSAVTWSSESELKMVPAAGGVALTWRGSRGGKLVRQLVVLGLDLAATSDAVDVGAASCATHDAFWFAERSTLDTRPWGGGNARFALPRDKNASLVCGSHAAFALLDEDDGTSLMMFGASDGGTSGAGLVPLFKDAEFGDDEQRERAEFTVGDDLGVVRLASSGALTLREVNVATAGAPLLSRKLKTLIGRDDDVVAVDASSQAIVVVFTEEVPDGCRANGSDLSWGSIRVKALRIERATHGESVVELSPGVCGHEVGPFFTSGVGDAVSVAWVERVAVAGQPRAPISGLVHRRVTAAGPLGELTRVDVAADALVDAGCDVARCYAVALVRRNGMDAMVPGLARVIRY